MRTPPLAPPRPDRSGTRAWSFIRVGPGGRTRGYSAPCAVPLGHRPARALLVVPSRLLGSGEASLDIGPSTASDGQPRARRRRLVSQTDRGTGGGVGCARAACAGLRGASVHRGGRLIDGRGGPRRAPGGRAGARRGPGARVTRTPHDHGRSVGVHRGQPSRPSAAPWWVPGGSAGRALLSARSRARCALEIRKRTLFSPSLKLKA